MLTEVAIVPSAPLLVPELAGPDAVETETVRAAALAAGTSAATARRWVAVGAGGPLRRFAAYGADVPVSLTPGGPDSPLPLSMLVAAWLRGAVAPDCSMEAVVVDPDASPDEIRSATRRVIDLVDADHEPTGLVIVADGATSLSPSAPGGGDRESAHALQSVIDAALRSADVQSLASLDAAACAAEGVGGRAALQVLAGVAAGRELTAHLRYADSPFGVGYTVATWTVA